MGMPQPDSPETPENAVSEGHDRSQRTSMESPKAAQPSCLRGGFIRMFLKRTEQDTEDASSSNQSTEHKHGVRGKKRKVLGGNIFRLSCLRPAERTDTSEQVNAQGNKVDEQGNQAIPEEELKPYSKASFLRKIRCYRLMRERDATEKEKVVEMEQCKEVSVLEVRHEKNIDLGGKITKPRRYEDTLGEKRKVSVEKESQQKVQGEKSSPISKEERKVESSTDVGDSYKEQYNDKKLRDQKKTVDERDNSGMDIGIRNNMVEHKKIADAAELGNDHQEHGNCAGRAIGQREEDIVSQESHTETVKDMDKKVTKQDKQTGDVQDTGNSVTIGEINSQRIHELENDLPEHSQLTHTNNAGVEANYLPGQDSSEDTEDVINSSPKQDNNEGEKRTKFSEQKKDGEVMKVVIDREGHTEIAKDTPKKEEKVKQLVEKLPQIKSNEENLEGSENSLLGKDSHKENEENLLQHKNHAENAEEPKKHYQEQNIGEAIVQFVEQDSLIKKDRQVKDYFLEQDSHIQKERKAVVRFLEEDNHIQKEEKAGKRLLEHDSHIQKEGKARVHFLEQDGHLQKEEKAKDYFLEQDGHTQKERKTVVRFLDEDIHIQKEEKAGRNFLEQDSHIQKEGKAGDQFLEGGSHLQKEGKKEDQLQEQAIHLQKEGKDGVQFLEGGNHLQKEGKQEDQLLEQKKGKVGDRFLEGGSHLQKEGKAGDHFKEKESHIQNVEELKECLVGQKSNIENIREPEALHLQQGRHEKLGNTQAQITEQDILAVVQDHLLEETECVKEHKGLEKVFPEEVKDLSVKPEIQFANITCTARSKEPHTEFLTFQEQESATNTVDFNYYHKEGSQEDINDSEDEVMEDSEWKSLQVEVRGMVQWLVEEASDRLTCFTQESQGTE